MLSISPVVSMSFLKCSMAKSRTGSILTSARFVVSFPVIGTASFLKDEVLVDSLLLTKPVVTPKSNGLRLYFC